MREKLVCEPWIPFEFFFFLSFWCGVIIFCHPQDCPHVLDEVNWFRRFTSEPLPRYWIAFCHKKIVSFCFGVCAALKLLRAWLPSNTDLRLVGFVQCVVMVSSGYVLWLQSTPVSLSVPQCNWSSGHLYDMAKLLFFRGDESKGKKLNGVLVKCVSVCKCVHMQHLKTHSPDPGRL